MSDTVSVTIPPRTSHVALLRAAASALAARMDFPVDRITELQIVVDEMCSRLLAVSEGPTRLTMRFRIQDGSARDASLGVEGCVDGGRRPDRELLSEWSSVILETIGRGIKPRFDTEATCLEIEVPRTAL